MEPKPTTIPSAEWDLPTIRKLIRELWTLRKAMVAGQNRATVLLEGMSPAWRDSALNLAHYLTLRAGDLRLLQERLAAIGVSSLGRSETHVLANIDKVLGILHRLGGRPWTALQAEEPSGIRRGAALLAEHTETLFGPPPPARGARIMVTLPSEAAGNAELVHRLVGAGMDIARINCAHDEAPQWTAMAGHVRAAAHRAGRTVRILMDLGGPKLRTGPVAGPVSVVKLQPQRDALGRVTVPARLGLRAALATGTIDGAHHTVAVLPAWLKRLHTGDTIRLTDARGAQRKLQVLRKGSEGALVECQQTVYLTAQTPLRLERKGHDKHAALPLELPVATGRLHLQRGQIMHLVAQGLGHGPLPAQRNQRARPATIACTLPEVLPRVRKGERVWFDDGHIGAVVLHGGRKRLELEITDVRETGEHLGADKGINLPDTRLALPALTAKDMEDLPVVVRLADMVGLSFAQSAGDVADLRAHLAALGASQLGVVLKIETRRGFENLPEMLFAAMKGPSAGVMIARGDLAVECGYERLAEVQEEILWACEAAHMPVVWATQVLETMVRTGMPSRAEITDAAMGARAECVMLNKGPHVLDAMRTLDDILRRMQMHQSKKRSMLRALRSWRPPRR